MRKGRSVKMVLVGGIALLGLVIVGFLMTFPLYWSPPLPPSALNWRACKNHQCRLFMALWIYTQDWDETFPPDMHTMALREVLLSSAEVTNAGLKVTHADFTCPEDAYADQHWTSYSWNQRLEQKNLPSLQKREGVPVLWDSDFRHLRSDGKLVAVVTELSGDMYERVTEADFRERYGMEP